MSRAGRLLEAAYRDYVEQGRPFWLVELSTFGSRALHSSHMMQWNMMQVRLGLRNHGLSEYEEDLVHVYQINPPQHYIYALYFRDERRAVEAIERVMFAEYEMAHAEDPELDAGSPQLNILGLLRECEGTEDEFRMTGFMAYVRDAASEQYTKHTMNASATDHVRYRMQST